MKTTFLIIQIILSIALTALIFLQAPSDSDGRGNILSSTHNTKRGWEKVMFNLTIFILVVFIISSLIQTTL